MAASLATAVPESPMAMPISAFFRAGASLTPSPVIATTWPSALRACTIRSLCSGATRANTATVLTRSVSAAADSASSSAPSITSPSIPSSHATVAAVIRWSPVIIFTVIPACLHRAIASRASGCGGSEIPANPTRVRSQMWVIRSPSGSKSLTGSVLSASASTRIALPARRLFSAFQ